MADLIDRQAAIDALARAAREKFNLSDEFNHYLAGLMDGENAIRQLPSAQPDRDVIDDCLRHIHKNISVHTATGGVITIRYYMEKLYEEIYGEGERPWWMT